MDGFDYFMLTPIVIVGLCIGFIIADVVIKKCMEIGFWANVECVVGFGVFIWLMVSFVYFLVKLHGVINETPL